MSGASKSVAPRGDGERVLAGRYRLEREIGRGGMGVVHRGTDLVIERSVAVKLLRFEGDAEDAEAAERRFFREVKSVARLQHEHIVQVFDFGRSDGGEPFLVMELLDGKPLSRLLRAERRLPPARAAEIAAQIAEALDAAHRGGLVHRDLKPQNVMLIDRADGGDFVKLIDFGVAKAADHATLETRPGEILGTIGYMAPEQIHGAELDGRADLYAAGVLAYQMLTGVAVFEDRGLPAMIHDHLHAAPVLPSERAPDMAIPNALDAAVLRCLAKKREDRFESARDLAVALRRAAAPSAGAPIAVAVSREPVPADAEIAAAPTERARAIEAAGMDQELDAPVFELADVPPVKPPSLIPGPRRCATCGADNARYARVCAHCGAPVDGAAPLALPGSDALAVRAPDALAPLPEPDPLAPLTPLDRALAPFKRAPAGVWKRAAVLSAAGLGLWGIVYVATADPTFKLVVVFLLAIGALVFLSTWKQWRRR
jgi:eukaryotic-like serine/threonine-protein kinase